MLIEFFGKHRNRLGESPLWRPELDQLWWVDAIEGEIHAADADGTPVSRWRYDQPAGSIAPAQGGLVAAMADGFHLVDEAGVARQVAAPGGDGLRFNDGKTDRSGRFLSGQMVVGDGEPRARLWRLDRDGRATALLEGLGITNAICFSPDGATLYVADSREGVLRSYPYDGRTGAIGERRDVVDCRVHGSPPDGATVDAAGNVWVALVLAQAVACFSPGGELLRRIDVPIPFPSCPAFGGTDLSTLFVTTIADSGNRLVTDHPDGGRILAIRDLGAVGLSEGEYRPDNHMGE